MISETLSIAGLIGEPQPQLAWVQTIVLLLLAVALTVVSELLRPKPDFEDARPAGLGDFDFPTATEGRGVPIVWGSVKIAGPNVTWYGDLLVSPIKEKVSTGLFSSDRITVGFHYRVGIQMALCHGVVDELYRIDVGEQQVFPSAAQSPLTSTTKDVLIDLPNAFGGDSEGGGIVGEFEWYTGTGDESDANISQYLANQIAGGVLNDTPAFVNVSHLVWRGPSSSRITGVAFEPPSFDFPNGRTTFERQPNGYLGTRARIDPWAFYVRRFPNQLGVTGGKERIGDDANPASVMYELLVDNVWGLNVTPSQVDNASFISAADTLHSEGNGFSLVWADQRSARDLANEVARQADGILIQNEDGLYQFKLVRAPTQQELDDAFVLDESNVLELKEFARTAWNQTFNHVQINYKDRDDEFKDTSAVEQDLANFLIQGQRDVVASSQWPGIKEASVAKQVARRELRLVSFPLAKAELECNRTATVLQPGQIAKFSWPELGIQDMILRIGKLDLGELADGRVVVSAVEDVFGLGFGGFADPPVTEWVAPQAQPIDAPVQLVFPMPGLIAQQLGGDPLNESRLMSVVPKVQGAAIGVRPQWNFGDPATEWGNYGPLPEDGEAGGMAPSAELQSLLVAHEAGGPVVPSITIENATDDFIQKVLKDFESQDADGLRAGLNLVMVGGPGFLWDDRVEFMAFESITDNGDGTYDLVNVHRGLGDTVPSDHPAGDRIYFLPPSVAAYHLTDLASVWPGWDGGSQTTALDTDTRNRVVTPFGILEASDASQQKVTFREFQNSGTVGVFSRDGATRIFMPLPAFDVILKMDPDPDPATTPFYVPGVHGGPSNVGLIAPPQQISGLTGALNCRLEWKARARNSSLVKLPGDSADTLDATSEPGEYPVDSPNASDEWWIRVRVRGVDGGTTEIVSPVLVGANTGFFEFTLPDNATSNSGIVHIFLDTLRRDGVEGINAQYVASRTPYTCLFERI